MKYDAKVAEKIKLKASSFYASSRVWNDGIILPHQTRKVRPQNMMQSIAEKIKLKASSFYASSRMWNDGIILPHQTRKVRPQNMMQR